MKYFFWKIDVKLSTCRFLKQLFFILFYQMAVNFEDKFKISSAIYIFDLKNEENPIKIEQSTVIR